jgi:hypothetical protein
VPHTRTGTTDTSQPSIPEVTVARQSPNRPEADEPAADEPVADAVSADVDAADAAADNADVAVAPARSGSSSDAALTGSALWEQTRISPVEIALPAGVLYTLRAYRLASELTPTETDLTAEEDPFDARERAAAARAEAEDDEEVVILDEEYAALMAEGEADSKGGKGAKDGDVEEPDPADFEDEKDDAKGDDEEVPIFLSHRGRLLGFKSPESLVSFIRSGAPHDLAQLESWPSVAERVRTTDIAPQADDRYELDLVVENLRGGHDTWDLPLLIAAGEVARDLGYALRLKPVIMALSSGSPLDDLDDSLRSASTGGMGGFFGRRRLRKIGAQQASLGWRSIIGKISAAVDWRD